MSDRWKDDPARDELLRDCIGNGISLNQARAVFAEKLGVDLSRNALIGRAFRLGLSVPKPQRKEHDTLARRSRRVAIKPKPRPVKSAPEPVTASSGVALIDLMAWHCRFINGDGLYCGSPKLEHSSYCSWHHRICYCKPHR